MNAPDFAETIDKSERALQIAEVQRLVRENARHESNQRVEVLIRNLDLAIGVAQKLYEMLHSANFTEKDMTSAEMTLEQVEVFRHAHIRGVACSGHCGNQCSGQRQGGSEVCDTGIDVRPESV